MSQMKHKSIFAGKIKPIHSCNFSAISFRKIDVMKLKGGLQNFFLSETHLKYAWLDNSYH